MLPEAWHMYIDLQSSQAFILMPPCLKFRSFESAYA